MAKVSKRKLGKRDRWERRFVPRSTANPWLVHALGGVGAMALGAGFWGQFGTSLRKAAEGLEPWPYASYALAGGAALIGAAIWVGTSSAPAIRVGSGGIAEERGVGRRIPWWGVASIRYDGAALVVEGADEHGGALTIKLPLAAFPEAASWVYAEASDRIPSTIDLSDDVKAALGVRDKEDGEAVDAMPLQLVGKRCSKTDKIIAYEPDARVCNKCERVYHKLGVPKTCACGASLAFLRDKGA